MLFRSHTPENIDEAIDGTQLSIGVSDQILIVAFFVGLFPSMGLRLIQRAATSTLGKFKINDHAEAYAELLYVDSRSEVQLAPTPATSIRVDLDSPYLSQSALDLLATRDDPGGPVVFRRRMVELGARSQESDSKLGQVTAGLRGDINYRDWQYDTYMSYGRTDYDNYTSNDVSRSRFEAGIAG